MVAWWAFCFAWLKGLAQINAQGTVNAQCFLVVHVGDISLGQIVQNNIVLWELLGLIWRWLMIWLTKTPSVQTVASATVKLGLANAKRDSKEM